MSLAINTNLISLNSQRALAKTQNLQSTAMARLSSGLRINSARDDAAGLAIGTKMDSQVRGLTVAIRNANDGISMIQTADGALNTLTGIYQRMRELAVQASNGSYGSSDYTQLDTEYQELSTEASRIASSTKFNDLALISGDSGSFTFQVGANAGDTMTVTTGDAASYLTTPGDLTNAANSSTALTALTSALDSLNSDRSVYGSSLNRFDFIVENLQISAENQSAARGRIMDADFAQETASLARQQVLQQAGVAMLAQANQAPSLILSLLR